MASRVRKHGAMSSTIVLIALCILPTVQAVSCTECAVVASMLEEKFDILLAAKGADAVHHLLNDHGNDDTADYHVRQGRNFGMTSGLSEPEIMETLGHFCSDMHTENTHGEETERLASSCRKLMTESAMDGVEDAIFHHGPHSSQCTVSSQEILNPVTITQKMMPHHW